MNTTTQPHALVIDDLVIPVRIDPDHEYTLASKEVALGYEVSESNIREMKRAHASELKEGKHFISVRNPDANPRAGIPHVSTHWTKRGIIRLGFFIRSERAERFRDMAEDLIIREDARATTGGQQVSTELLSMIGQLTQLMTRTVDAIDRRMAVFEDRLSEVQTKVERQAMPLLNEPAPSVQDRYNLEASLLALALLSGRKHSFDVPFPKVVATGRDLGLDDFQIPTGPCRLPGYRGPNSRSMQSSLGKRVSKLLNGRVFLVDGIEWSLVKRGNARGSHYRAIREN